MAVRSSTHTHRIAFRCSEDLTVIAAERARLNYMSVPEYLRYLVRQDAAKST